MRTIYQDDLPPEDTCYGPGLSHEDNIYDEEPESDNESFVEVDPDLTADNTHLRLQYHINEYHTRCWGTEPVDFTQGPDTWRWFRLPDYVPVQVSDAGFIRDSQTHMVSNGFSEAGTPYRVYVLRSLYASSPSKLVPVHDLVWQAFRGPLPPGYKVGHNTWALREKDSFGKLPNDLGSLELVPTAAYSTF